MIFLNPFRFGVPIPIVINPILQRVLDYATANTITAPSGATLTALNTYCNAMEANGILAHTGSGGTPTDASDFTTSDVFFNFAYNDVGLEDFSLIDWIRLVEADVYGTITYTIEGYEGDASTGYLDPLFNPTADGNNYTLNNAGYGGIIYKERVLGNVVIGQESGAINILNNSSATSQRINRASNLSAAMDLSGEGLILLNREDSTTVSGIQKANYDQRTAQSEATSVSNVKFNMLRYVSSVFSDAGMASAFLGKHIPNTMAQDVRTATNNYLSEIGLTPIA